MAKEGSTTGAADRCSCGRAIDADHQYCPSCGSPTAEPDSLARLDPAGGSLLLSGRDAGSAATQSTVRTGPGLLPRLVGIGLAIVGVILMWALFRQPTSEVAPEPAQEEAVADTSLPRGGDRAETGHHP